MEKVKTGQSMIEYVIVFAIVIGALIVAGNMFSRKAKPAIDQLSSSIQSKVGGK